MAMWDFVAPPRQSLRNSVAPHIVAAVGRLPSPSMGSIVVATGKWRGNRTESTSSLFCYALVLHGWPRLTERSLIAVCLLYDRDGSHAWDLTALNDFEIRGDP